jgi:hypothetical protein
MKDKSKVGKWVAVKVLDKVDLPAMLDFSNKDKWDSFRPQWNVG